MARKGKPRGGKPKSDAVILETPERAQHAAAIVDRALGTAIGSPKGRMVQSPLDRLAARSAGRHGDGVSPRMQSAGIRLREDFDRGVMAARESPGEQLLGVKAGFGPAWITDRQIDALTAYKAAVRCLGPYVGAVVVAVCCYEKDVSRIAAEQGRGRDKVMGVLEDGLKTLADHYKMTGRD